MNISRLIVFALIVAACGAGQTPTRVVAQNATERTEEMKKERARVRAPELNGGRDWLNTERPLSLAALKGKVVLLDFWTYGCINCIHIIPDLKRLEAKYSKELVVIGVHSAKFTNERETENIRRIILRYGIEHPVINDADFAIWKAYGVRAWPTQALIDPTGYIIGFASGEGNYEAIDKAIAQTIATARLRGELNEQPLQLVLERARTSDLPLAFPGKVLADEGGRRLFIADSNHNRIVVTNLDGTLVETIGAGSVGAQDGAFATATFNRPQGLALDGDTLYVADTENHLIRRVDLRAKIVTTVAGTGAQSQAPVDQGGAARATALSSPWDLQLTGRTLYIAMAGPHQIWKLDLDAERIEVFAGTGREARQDGALEEAAFAQPSGLASDGKTLYVADSEANIIRAIDLAAGRVRTLAGGDLFDFGDRDGAGDDVRLQHPLGLVYDHSNNTVLIADTYNHKIKRLDPRTHTVKTFAGTGKPGQMDNAKAPSFYEPAGLSIAGGKLYIADTDNQAIRVLDLKTKQTSTLMIKGLEPPHINYAEANADVAPNQSEINASAQALRANADGTLVVDVTLPAGYHLNAAAPQRYKVMVEKGEASIAAPSNAARQKGLTLPLRLPLVTNAPGAVQLRLETTLYFCREDNTGTCRVKTLVWHLPIEVAANAAPEIKARATIGLDE